VSVTGSENTVSVRQTFNAGNTLYSGGNSSVVNIVGNGNSATVNQSFGP
jgi:hypothetical protein